MTAPRKRKARETFPTIHTSTGIPHDAVLMHGVNSRGETETRLCSIVMNVRVLPRKKAGKKAKP